MPVSSDFAGDEDEVPPPDERWYPTAEAFEKLTGRRPSPPTCYRMQKKRGLKTTLYLGRHMISLRAAREFLEASSGLSRSLTGSPHESPA